MLDAGARVIHVDVMDGHFVPPITMGPLVVEALADQVHAAGAVARRAPDDRAPGAPRRRRSPRRAPTRSRSTPRRRRTCTTRCSAIRDAGCRAGAGAQPGDAGRRRVAEVAGDVDLVLCMTVNPGWGGQAFIPSSLEQDRAPARAARRRTRRSRSTAASTPTPPAPCAAGRRDACSSPARRCSARPIPRGGRGARSGDPAR